MIKTPKFQDLTSTLSQLVRINNTEYKSIERRMDEYLQFGLDNTGFNTGIISRIEKDVYTILHSISWNKDCKAGLQVPRFDTLCNTVYESHKPLFVPCVSDTHFKDLPGAIFLNLQAYICSPIIINNEVYGTLTFCAEETCDSQDDWNFACTLVDLLSQSVAKIIKETLLIEKLDEEKKLLEMGSKLNRMVTVKTIIKTGQLTCASNFNTLWELDLAKSLDEIDYKELMSKIIEEDHPIVLQAFKKSVHQDLEPFEYRIKRFNGNYRWIRHQSICNREKGYVLSIMQDITSIKNNELQLAQNNKELEQIAYATAHDLQEPLKTIECFTTLLKKKHGDKIGSAGNQYLGYLNNASTRMKNQIDGLLEHSTIGKNGSTQLLNLKVLLENILERFEPEIKQSNAKINITDLPIICTYPKEQKILWENLISNALKFRREDQKCCIDISATSSPTHWIFKISDNGIGMESKNIPKIFQLYSQLNPKGKYKGTGVGLAHCHKIIKLHHGETRITSSLNKGTTIQFTIKKSINVNN